jgi:hypothetical protein
MKPVTTMVLLNIVTVRVIATVCFGALAEQLQESALFCVMKVGVTIRIALLWMTLRNQEVTMMVVSDQRMKSSSKLSNQHFNN